MGCKSDHTELKENGGFILFPFVKENLSVLLSQIFIKEAQGSGTRTHVEAIKWPDGVRVSESAEEHTSCLSLTKQQKIQVSPFLLTCQ